MFSDLEYNYDEGLRDLLWIGVLLKTHFKWLLIIVDILLLVLISYPIFQGGIVGGYDPGFHMGRIHTLATSLSSGHFPNPIGLEYLGKLTYGVGFFYGNFFIYPFALLNIAGVKLFSCYIAYLIIFAGLGIVAINVVTQKLFHDNWATLLSGPLYMSSYYLITIIYARAAVGELTALAIIPWILLSVIKIAQGETKYWVMFGLSFSALLVSHILSFMITLVSAIILVLLNLVPVVKSRKIIWSYCKGTLLFVGLSSVFLLPFIQQYTLQKYNDTALDPTGHFLILEYSEMMKNHVFDIQELVGANGIFLNIVFVSSILYYLFKYFQKRDFHICNKIIPQLFILYVLLSAMIVSTALLQYAVKKFPSLVTLQCITRLNVVIMPIMTLVSASAIGDLIKNWGKFIFPITAIILATIAVITINFPIKTNMKDVASRRGPIFDTSISMGEYQPEAFAQFNNKYWDRVTAKYLAANQGYSIVENDHDAAVVKISNNQSARIILLPRLYYKGYQTTIKYDGKTVKANALSQNGLAAVNLPKDFRNGKVSVSYRDTDISRAGWLITLLTVVSMCGLGIYKWIKKRM